MYAFVCGYVHLRAGAPGGQKMVQDLLVLKLQEGMSCQVWVWGAELGEFLYKSSIHSSLLNHLFSHSESILIIVFYYT